MNYPQAFKAKMVRKMTGPEALSASALAEDTGLSQPTLSRWLREVGDDKVSDMKKKRPHDRSAEERLSLLIEADALPEEELGAFSRRHGVHRRISTNGGRWL